MTVIRIADGVYRVMNEGRVETVFVAGSADGWWAFWNGQVFHGGVSASPRDTRPGAQRSEGVLPLTAPMPATVAKVLVEPGSAVQRGSAVVVLEAMKMEMPIRATRDAVVRAIRCRPGDLVQTDAVLVEFE
jgi:biotin carboxyl carrier protein